MSRINVSISNPCSQNWDNFQKHGNDAFCLSCQKNIIDFTKYSDHEIIEYFKKNASNKTCGRFKNSQLKTYTLPKKKNDFSAIAAILTAGILTISSPAEAEEDWIHITGHVISKEDHEALPGVDVLIKGTNKGTTTDAEGNFSIFYYADEDEPLVLTYSFIGLQTMEQAIILSQPTKDIGTISLAADVMTLGSVCITDPWYSPRRWWMGIKGIFGRGYGGSA